MTFHQSAIFPTAISRGASGGPGHATLILAEGDAGQERTVIKQEQAKRSWNVSTGLRQISDMAELVDFILCREGAAHGFRYKDWFDFSTDSSHAGVNAVDMLDHQFGTGDASTKEFQLSKTYSSGSYTKVRNIEKPIASTVVVAKAGTIVNSSQYTVDESTGRISFLTAPALGNALTWGGEFYVPCRFGEGVDQRPNFVYEDFESAQLADLEVVELLNTSPVNDQYFYGGASDLGTKAASFTLSLGNGRVQSFFPSVALDVTLPDPAGLPYGGPHFVLANNGAAIVTIRDHTATIISYLYTGKVITGYVGKIGGTPTWYVR